MGREANFGDKLGSAGFHVNPQNINKKGAPKKIYTVLKRKGYSKTDTVAAFGELAYYSEKELREVEGDEKKPMITRIVSRIMIEAFENGDWAKIKDVIEHTIGRARQSVDNTHEIKQEQPLFE